MESLETVNIPFFKELHTIDDSDRIIIRLLSRIVPLPTKCILTIYDFPNWLCGCVEKDYIDFETLLLLCRSYCKQSFIINHTPQIKDYLLKRVQQSDKLNKKFNQASL